MRCSGGRSAVGGRRAADPDSAEEARSGRATSCAAKPEIRTVLSTEAGRSVTISESPSGFRSDLRGTPALVTSGRRCVSRPPRGAGLPHVHQGWFGRRCGGGCAVIRLVAALAHVEAIDRATLNCLLVRWKQGMRSYGSAELRVRGASRAGRADSGCISQQMSTCTTKGVGVIALEKMR